MESLVEKIFSTGDYSDEDISMLQTNGPVYVPMYNYTVEWFLEEDLDLAKNCLQGACYKFDQIKNETIEMTFHDGGDLCSNDIAWIKDPKKKLIDIIGPDKLIRPVCHSYVWMIISYEKEQKFFKKYFEKNI